MFRIASRDFVKQQVEAARQADLSYYSIEKQENRAMQQRVRQLIDENKKLLALVSALYEYFEIQAVTQPPVSEKIKVEKVVKSGK